MALDYRQAGHNKNNLDEWENMLIPVYGFFIGPDAVLFSFTWNIQNEISYRTDNKQIDNVTHLVFLQALFLRLVWDKII